MDNGEDLTSHGIIFKYTCMLDLNFLLTLSIRDAACLSPEIRCENFLLK